MTHKKQEAAVTTKKSKTAKTIEKKSPAKLTLKKAVAKGHSHSKKKSSSSSSSSTSSSSSFTSSSSSSESESDDNEGPATPTLSVCDANVFTHEMGGMARMEISQYQGKWRIDIRHYFLKDGKPLPTKKGINLSIDQWKKLGECTADATKFMKKHNIE